MALRHNVTANIASLWVGWFLAFTAAVALTVLAAVYARFPGDPSVAQWVQAVRLPGLAQVGDGLYYLGLSPLFPMAGITAAAVFFCTRERLAALFLVLSVLARLSVGPLKELSERPRPTPDLIQVSEHANGFSFPSGHVLGSVLLWGFLCYLAAKTIPHRGVRLGVQAVCLAIPALTGLQRIYAGAHWPSDVLGGYLWGGLILFVIISGYELCQGRLGIRRKATAS